MRTRWLVAMVAALMLIGVADQASAQKTGCGTENPCVRERQTAKPSLPIAGLSRWAAQILLVNSSQGHIFGSGDGYSASYKLASQTPSTHAVPGFGNVTGYRFVCYLLASAREHVPSDVTDKRCKDSPQPRSGLRVMNVSNGNALGVDEIIVQSGAVSSKRLSYFVLTGAIPVPSLVNSVHIACSTFSSQHKPGLLDGCRVADRVSGDIENTASTSTIRFSLKTSDNTANYGLEDLYDDYGTVFNKSPGEVQNGLYQAAYYSFITDVTKAPSAPPSVTVDSTTSMTTFKVSWAASTFNSATGYTVLLCAGATGTTCSTLGATNSSTYTRTFNASGNLTAGNTYRVAVVAFNSEGNSQRRYSASFVWSPVPQPPQSLSCTVSNGFDRGSSRNRSDGRIVCTWKAPAGTVTGYTFKSNVPLPSGVTRNLAANDLTETVLVPYDPTRNVQAATISVAAKNNNGTGTAATASGNVYPIPPAPTSVSLTPDVESVVVNWVDASVTSTTAETWEVAWGQITTGTTCGDAPKPTPLTNKADISTSTTRTYTATGLSHDIDYCFGVRKKSSSNRNGIRRWATTKTLDDSVGAPNPPMSVAIAIGAPTDNGENMNVSYSWTPPTDDTNLDAYEAQSMSDGVPSGRIQEFKDTTTLVSATPKVATTTSIRVRSIRKICADPVNCPNPSIRRSAWVTVAAIYLMETPTLTITAGATRVTASWSGGAKLLSEVVSWYLEYKLGTASAWTSAGTIPKASSSFTVTGLTDQTAYDFRFRAQNATHSSPFATANVTTVNEAEDGPNAPISVTATAFYNQTAARGEILMNWKAPTTGPATQGYAVEIQNGCTGAWTETNVGSALMYVFAPVSANTQYCVRVRGYRTFMGEFRYSGYVTAQRFYPSQPTTLTVTQIVNGLKLDWTQSALVTIAGFDLETTHRSVTTVDDTISPNLSTLTLPKLVVGDDYTFRIRARAPAPGGGAGQWSTAVTATVIDDSAGAPGAPINVSVSITVDMDNNALADATLSWQAGPAPAAEKYQASYQAAGDTTWTTINNDIASNVLSVDVDGLSVGASYAFRVRAVRVVNSENRYSAYVVQSAALSGERADPTSCQAEAVAVTGGGNQQRNVGLTLSWSPPTVAVPGSETPSAMIVEWRTGNEIDYEEVRLAGDAATYSLPAALAGQRYDFRLYAEFEFGAEYSDTLVVSIVADISSGTVECSEPEGAGGRTLPRPPEIFDVHLSRLAGDRDEVVIRWTNIEDALFYELRERLGYQDSRLLQSQGISRAKLLSGNHGERVGYASGGHIISHSDYRCPSGCWIGVENPQVVDGGPSYQIRLSGTSFYVLAMYGDQSNDSFYLVLQGDAYSRLISVATDWMEWELLTVDTRVDLATEETRQEFVELIVDLDPSIATEIYTEAVPAGAHVFGVETSPMRTVVRWEGGGQLNDFGTIDPILREPTLTTFKGAGAVARSTEQLAYVLHGTASWFSVRSVLEGNERSGWSAPRYYDATRSALPVSPFNEVLATATPSAANPENTPEDFGTRDFLGALGVGEGALQTQGLSVGLAVAASALVAGAGYFLTPGSNQQARVAILFLLLTTSWIVLAPTVGGLPFSFVAAPLVLVVVAGMIAIFRRAG